MRNIRVFCFVMLLLAAEISTQRSMRDAEWITRMRKTCSQKRKTFLAKNVRKSMCAVFKNIMILILAMFLVLNKDFKPNSSSSTEVLTYFKSLSKKKIFLNYKLKYLVKSLLTIDGPSL